MGSFVHTAELPCADPNGRANRAVLSAGADLGQLRVTAPDDERLPARAAAGAYLRSAYRGMARQVVKKIVRLASAFPFRRPFGLPTSQGRGGLGSMDSTRALGAFRIARDAGGEAVDVNRNLVEREKGD